MHVRAVLTDGRSRTASRLAAVQSSRTPILKNACSRPNPLVLHSAPPSAGGRLRVKPGHQNSWSTRLINVRKRKSLGADGSSGGCHKRIRLPCGGVAKGDASRQDKAPSVVWQKNQTDRLFRFLLSCRGSCRPGGSAWDSRGSGYFRLFSLCSFWRPVHRPLNGRSLCMHRCTPLFRTGTNRSIRPNLRACLPR